MAVRSGNHCKIPGADSAEAGAKAVHVVHEVEGVDDGEDPKDGDGVVEELIVNEESDAEATGSDGEGDKELAGEFDGGLQFVFVVENAEDEHSESAEKDSGEFSVTTFETMGEQVSGSRVQWNKFSEVRLEQQKERGGQHGKQEASHDREAASERDGAVVDFSVAGIVHQADAKAQLFPEGQSAKGEGEAAQNGEQIDVEGEHASERVTWLHGYMVTWLHELHGYIVKWVKGVKWGALKMVMQSGWIAAVGRDGRVGRSFFRREICL